MECNGLVKRLNQMIKRMSKRFVVEDPRGWPEMVGPVLFALQEVPRALTGYSPFDLLFGRRPMGILDLIREQWKGQVRQGGSKGKEDLGRLREKLCKMREVGRGNLEDAQLYQKITYDIKLWPRQFKTRDKVVLLLPTSESKFEAKWKGPFCVIKQVGEVDYEVEKRELQAGKIYHVNLLKHWKENVEQYLWVESREERELGPTAGEAFSDPGKQRTGEELSSE